MFTKPKRRWSEEEEHDIREKKVSRVSPYLTPKYGKRCSQKAYVLMFRF